MVRHWITAAMPMTVPGLALSSPHFSAASADLPVGSDTICVARYPLRFCYLVAIIIALFSPTVAADEIVRAADRAFNVGNIGRAQQLYLQAREQARARGDRTAAAEIDNDLAAIRLVQAERPVGMCVPPRRSLRRSRITRKVPSSLSLSGRGVKIRLRPDGLPGERRAGSWRFSSTAVADGRFTRVRRQLCNIRSVATSPLVSRKLG
jgi:hypothetical protein